jgi:hypothetical protein
MRTRERSRRMALRVSTWGRRAPAVSLVGVLLLLGAFLLLAGCGGGATTTYASPATTYAAAASTTAPNRGESYTPSDSAGGDGSGSVAAGEMGSLSVAQAASGQKIISNASMQVEVDKGMFETVFARALLLADKYGGYVVTSQSTATGDESVLRSGTIALRIPSQSFNQALADAANLGKVQARTVDSQDVTQEYVDLKAQLVNAQSQETALLDLMARAKTVDEILKVRQVLSSTQAEIEQYKGRLNYLDEHTNYSTLTLSLFEPGTAVKQTGVGWGFVQALKDALHGFVNSMNELIVFMGGALPVLVILAILAYIGYRIVRSTQRRHERERAQATLAWQAQQHSQAQVFPAAWAQPQAESAQPPAPASAGAMAAPVAGTGDAPGGTGQE